MFIGDVFAEAKSKGYQGSLSDFGRELRAAQKAGHIDLARADLVAAMDPKSVAASTINVDGARFHFVVRKKR